ncbi:hypothetical protein CsSME_00029725 [Camellia sinensis var. sinensis]
MVVRPVGVNVRHSGSPYTAHTSEDELEVEFQQDQLPTTNEGHEGDALKLFSAIEASWKQSNLGDSNLQMVGQKDKRARELRRLECSINYDRNMKGSDRRFRNERGDQLLLPCREKDSGCGVSSRDQNGVPGMGVVRELWGERHVDWAFQPALGVAGGVLMCWDNGVVVKEREEIGGFI